MLVTATPIFNLFPITAFNPKSNPHPFPTGCGRSPFAGFRIALGLVKAADP